MSQLFLPNRFSATRPLLSARESPLLLSLRAGARVKQQQQQASDKRSVFIQQQRRYVGGSNAGFSKYRAKSRIWMCGLGVGVALAVGLKYAANSSYDDKVEGAERSHRYSAAVKVSRDLVERIKVGTEVGLLPAGCLTDQRPLCFLLIPFASLQCHLYQFSVVSVCCQAEVGAPGLVVGVSVDGAQVWCEGWCLQSPLLRMAFEKKKLQYQCNQSYLFNITSNHFGLYNTVFI